MKFIEFLPNDLKLLFENVWKTIFVNSYYLCNGQNQVEVLTTEALVRNPSALLQL